MVSTELNFSSLSNVEEFALIASDPAFGSAGADTLAATVVQRSVFGLEGNDGILGVDTADNLLGGEGNDQLNGGKGDDLIDGGTGDDLPSGGGLAQVEQIWNKRDRAGLDFAANPMQHLRRRERC